MEVAGGLCAFMSHSFIKLFHNSSHTSDGISIKVRQFQNLFLLARERATLRLVDWGGGLGWGWAAGLVQKTYFPVCILCLLTSLLAHPVVLHQKGTT